MTRLPKCITVLALRQVAIEDIKKPICSCYWHSIGEPDMCLEKRMPFQGAESYRDDYMDDYPDFDSLEDGDDGPCTCHFCRTGKPEFCFEEDDGWNLIDLDLDCATDGAVPFDDIPEPQVRVNKHTRTSRHEQIIRWGAVCENQGAMWRLKRARAHESRKVQFVAPRRNRERVSQILAREEEKDRKFWNDQDFRYFDSYYPGDHWELHPQKRAELLLRNFPALCQSSAQLIASSPAIQRSSSFKGLEGLQRNEVQNARRDEDYFFDRDSDF